MRGSSRWMTLAQSIATAALGVAASIVLLPLAAHGNFSQVTRTVSVFAGSNLDTLPFRSSEFDDDYTSIDGIGTWDVVLEARQPGLGDAPDGIGRVALATNVTSTQVAFESHIDTNYHEVVGIPGGRLGATSWGHGSVLTNAYFKLSTPAAYSLALSSTHNQLRAENRGSAELLRHDVANQPPLSVFSEWLPHSDSPVHLTGVLEPGVYTIELYHRADAGLSTGMHALFVVPEPGTGMLLGMGLGLLARSRSRR